MKHNYSEKLNAFIAEKKEATKMINCVGNLLYKKGIELVLFRRHLLDKNVSEILRLHQYATNFVKKPINILDSANLAELLTDMDLAPAKIDIGKLTYEYVLEKEQYTNKSDFLNDKIGFMKKSEDKKQNAKDVVLYGFGRIGRLCARELIKQAGKGQQLRLRAIVTRSNSDDTIIKRAALLKNDSVHGAFKGSVIEDLENKTLLINGQIVQMISANKPEDVNYTEYGINNALVIDNTGVYTTKEELGRHLKSKGVSKVLLTAPGKEIPNIVYGINHFDLDVENLNIYSAASCTTNAISPILKTVNDSFNVVKGHIETVHAFS